MKSWVARPTGYPDALAKVELAAPSEPPSPNHVLVKVHAAALNPVDIQIMNLPVWPLLDYMPSAYRPSANRGIGEDFAGTVIKSGSAASQFKPGDRVHGFAVTLPGLGNSSGVLQDIAWIDITKACVTHAPATWSWEAAAAIPLVWLTARTCIDSIEQNVAAAAKDSGRKGKVAVLGASSSTGQYIVRQAVARGWDVMGTCSGRNADFVRSTLGASTVVDYTQQSVREGVAAFKPDAIVDAVGGTDTLDLAPRYVTIVGDKTDRAAMGGNTTYLYNPQMYARWLLGRVGIGRQYDCVNLQPNKAWLDEAGKLLSNDQIVIDSTFTHDNVPAAFERLATSRARGKVVITI